MGPRLSISLLLALVLLTAGCAACPACPKTAKEAGLPAQVRLHERPASR